MEQSTDPNSLSNQAMKLPETEVGHEPSEQQVLEGDHNSAHYIMSRSRHPHVKNVTMVTLTVSGEESDKRVVKRHFVEDFGAPAVERSGDEDGDGIDTLAWLFSA